MITVVGSVAYDSVRTPAGERQRMLGGAATHFALAASHYAPVRIVASVGGDFAEHDLDLLATRGTALEDLERIPEGETFFWSGVYSEDMASRETLATELGVFAEFRPDLSAAASQCELLFLANMHPGLQLHVLEQCDSPRYVALDSMDLWIATERKALLEVLARVDWVVLSDDEVRQLSGREDDLDGARQLLELGPSVVVVKRAERGAVLVSDREAVSQPAYPVTDLVDPTGAGDTFAGGFLGYLAGQMDRAEQPEVRRKALAHGAVAASFNVEAFGVEGMRDLAFEQAETRLAAIAAAEVVAGSSKDDTIEALV